MSKLYIASVTVRPLDAQPSFEHLYLVFVDDDGIEKILRGGKALTTGSRKSHLPHPKAVLIEDGFPGIENKFNEYTSADARNPHIGETPERRNFTLLATGEEADDHWDHIMSFMQSLGIERTDGKILSGFHYCMGDRDYNSVIGSALAHIGIDLLENLPVIGGSNTIGETEGKTRLRICDVDHPHGDNMSESSSPPPTDKESGDDKAISRGLQPHKLPLLALL